MRPSLNKNPFVAPYVTCYDPRFNFLEHTFLKYRGEWEESIEGRGVNFTTGDRNVQLRADLLWNKNICLCTY